MQDADKELLLEAIARNSAAVLSLPSAGMLRHQKSRFLSEAADGFWIESAPGESALIQELIASQTPCGVSFKTGITKVIFTSPVSASDPEYRINAETCVPALLMGYPENVKTVQRRNTYRAPVTADAEITVRTWRMGAGVHISDRPMAVQMIATELRDLSIGGMGVTFTGIEKEPPKVTPDDRLRIELRFADQVLLLEGFMKHPTSRPTTLTVRAGIQFKELTNDLEGRRIMSVLARLVGELQRSEARRYRRGITPAA